MKYTFLDPDINLPVSFMECDEDVDRILRAAQEEDEEDEEEDEEEEEEDEDEDDDDQEEDSDEADV